jgi:hypothetical protein
LPSLAKDSIAELVLAPEFIQDESIRTRLSDQRNVPFLKGGTIVLFGVSPTMVANHSAKGLIAPADVSILSAFLFVEARLEANLWLQVRGDR